MTGDIAQERQPNAVGLVNAAEEIIGAPLPTEAAWLVPAMAAGTALAACLIVLGLISFVWRRSTAALVANPRDVAMRRIGRMVKSG